MAKPLNKIAITRNIVAFIAGFLWYCPENAIQIFSANPLSSIIKPIFGGIITIIGGAFVGDLAKPLTDILVICTLLLSIYSEINKKL